MHKLIFSLKVHKDGSRTMQLKPVSFVVVLKISVHYSLKNKGTVFNLVLGLCWGLGGNPISQLNFIILILTYR